MPSPAFTWDLNTAQKEVEHWRRAHLKNPCSTKNLSFTLEDEGGFPRAEVELLAYLDKIAIFTSEPGEFASSLPTITVNAKNHPKTIQGFLQILQSAEIRPEYQLAKRDKAPFIFRLFGPVLSGLESADEQLAYAQKLFDSFGRARFPSEETERIVLEILNKSLNQNDGKITNKNRTAFYEATISAIACDSFFKKFSPKIRDAISQDLKLVKEISHKIFREIDNDRKNPFGHIFVDRLAKDPFDFKSKYFNLINAKHSGFLAKALLKEKEPDIKLLEELCESAFLHLESYGKIQKLLGDNVLSKLQNLNLMKELINKRESQRNQESIEVHPRNKMDYSPSDSKYICQSLRIAKWDPELKKPENKELLQKAAKNYSIFLPRKQLRLLKKLNQRQSVSTQV